MRNGVLAAVALAALLDGAGCGDDQRPQAAAELWDRIHADGYRQWARAPGYEARRSSDAPHGGAVDIYVNDVVAKALAAEGSLAAWPEGSLVVKDGFDGDSFELVAAMEKRDGSWFWAEYDSEGSASHSGGPSVCTDCHASGADFVRAFSLP